MLAQLLDLTESRNWIIEKFLKTPVKSAKHKMAQKDTGFKQKFA
jgi:hypothetical protein